ncbi:MAG TPA: phosphatase PAP2 family protein [Gaiellaceae bacterium]|nr:phosphatase PAP2 family protein [Gaiellaceae bacterium]
MRTNRRERARTAAGRARRAGRRRPLLPYGVRHAVLQAAIWAAFSLAYEGARGLARGSGADAVDHARRVVRLEQHLGGLIERDLQRPVLDPAGVVLLHAVNWTYWLSQFAVVLVAVVWVYLRRPDAYPRLRNTIIVANTIGLAGYVLFPLAPPRLVPGLGLVDTLARTEPLNHRTAIVQLVANPYAAMPSLHAADAIIVGVTLAALVRPLSLRLAAGLWPAWVCWALVATGNHFWLDEAAGAVLAGLAAWLVRRRAAEQLLRRAPGAAGGRRPRTRWLPLA